MYLSEFLFCLDVCPRVGWLDHMVALFLVFLRNLNTVWINVSILSNIILTNSIKF